MKEIPKRPGSVWDGTSIYRTKNCYDCIFYREINGYELCGVGRAFKYLEERESKRKCSIRNKPSSNPSVVYLDEIVARAS